MNSHDLQLTVNTLPDAGRVLEGELSLAWLDEALLDAYTARTPLSVRFDVRPMASSLGSDDTVLVTGTATARLAFECSRTLVPSETTFNVEFSELFVPESSVSVTLSPEDEDVDPELLHDEPWVIRGGIIDLEQLLREALVLAQEPYPVADGSAVADPDKPLWTSRATDVDGRWAKLADLKLD